mgnify:CR=1 FL=1
MIHHLNIIASLEIPKLLEKILLRKKIFVLAMGCQIRSKILQSVIISILIMLIFLGRWLRNPILWKINTTFLLISLLMLSFRTMGQSSSMHNEGLEIRRWFSSDGALLRCPNYPFISNYKRRKKSDFFLFFCMSSKSIDENWGKKTWKNRYLIIIWLFCFFNLYLQNYESHLWCVYNQNSCFSWFFFTRRFYKMSIWLIRGEVCFVYWCIFCTSPIHSYSSIVY